MDRAVWTALFAQTADSGRSLQWRLREMIIAAGAKGYLKETTLLPSSRSLAVQLGVARNTVILAYEQLVSEGVISPYKRRGFFMGQTAAAAPTEQSPPPLEASTFDLRLQIKPSLQRNIVKTADWLRYPYPFIYGQFDPETFPINAWRECVKEALSVVEIRDWAPDRLNGDDPQLLELLSSRLLPRRGIWVTNDDVMITLGAQQAIYILAELLVGPDTVVGIEDPGYPDTRNILSLRTSEIRSIPVDEDGLIVDAIPHDVKIIFLTPTRQCPTGATLSAERRAALMRLAQARDIIVVEDDYESDFGSGGESIPALKSAADGDRVVYVGSLSKRLAPGLRFGYLVASHEILREAKALRRLMLRHAPTNNQRALALFIGLGHFDVVLRRSSEALAERAAILEKALATYLPDFQRPSRIHGSSAWLKGPDDLHSGDLGWLAQGEGILLEPGDVFFNAAEPPTNYIRLGFSSISAQRIEAGIRTLAQIWQNMPLGRRLRAD
jgi:GntR family transcriptional regulator/MocR family aminotransferase